MADYLEQSFFANNNDADFLLIITTAAPSPICESEISKWNAHKRRPVIRAWPGYQLQRILSRFPAIRLKYGLLTATEDKGASFVSLAVDSAKFTQAAYAVSELKQDNPVPLEAAAALAELLSVRMQNFEAVGKIVIAPLVPAMGGRALQVKKLASGCARNQQEEKSMLEARIAKVVMIGCMALFALLVSADNLIDYGTNYSFVSHVLSMDTTFPGNALLYRRITSPVLWQAAYALIIAGEALTGVSLAIAAISMGRHLRSDRTRFNRAKRFVFVGATLGFLVWFFGFMVIGGEWFSMWESPKWNGQEAAFRFYLTILAVLIFVNQADDNLAA